MDRGIALSRQYGVDQLLRPIFDYVPTAESPPPAPKHITAPANRPKKGKGGAEDLDVAPKVSRVAAAAKAKAAREEKIRSAREAKLAQEAEMMSDEDVPMMDDRDFSASPSAVSDSSDTPSPLPSELEFGGADEEYLQGGGSAGPSKRRKYQQTTMQHPEMVDAQQQHAQQQQQQYQSQQHANAQLGQGPLRYARMILDYFVSESTQIPSFLISPPSDFDANVVIDDDGHTALHWACAMGRIRIVKLLLSAGADIFRANSMGQTALMRSVMFTNNYDLRKFPELFELLHRSTINIDRNDRTVFHYVVDIALQKGKTHAARYYIEAILTRLIDYPNEVADILNFQDEEGETALTLAARARSKRLVKILLDNGADPKISNRDGKTAEDYILEDERFRESELAANQYGGPNGSMGVTGGNEGGGGGGNGENSNRGGQGSLALYQFRPQLHTSESGQRATNRCIPETIEFLETLAKTFDQELEEQERDLLQAKTLLSSIQAEILEGQRGVNSLRIRSSGLEGLETRENSLREELEGKRGQRFRLGWEKWIRDEAKRETNYLAATSSSSATTTTTTTQEVNQVSEKDLEALIQLSQLPLAETCLRATQLRARLLELVVLRKSHFEQLTKLQREQGTGGRMENYRALIAMGCGVPLEEVEGVIESLCENLEAGQEEGV